MGETTFYSDGPKPTEERPHSSFRTGLSLAWTPSMIQNLTKGVRTWNNSLGRKNFINSSVIDILTAVKTAAKVAQVLQIIVYLFRAYF